LHNVSTYAGEVIEYQIMFSLKMFSLKSKLNIIGEFGHTLDIVGKPLVSRI
jgi:hypothetical protein